MKQKRNNNNNNNILKKVSLWKMQCPCFFSLSKPTKAPTLYTHSPFKLQNSQNGPQIVENDDGLEKFNESNSEGYENGRKSCIKKVEIGKESVRKRVEWVDNFGKELVQVNEFEFSDNGDTDNELENRTCSCLTL